MSRTKETWMRQEELADMYEWIEENYGEDAGEEGSDSWSDAVRAYEEHCDEIQQAHEDDLSREEYEYYLFMNSQEAESVLYRDISELRFMLMHSGSMSHNPTFLKMIFAHAITVLEVYLEDTTKSLILSSETHLANTIKSVKPFSDTSFKLSEIPLETDGIKKFVINKISDNLFHNIPKTLTTLESILGRKLKVTTSNVCRITNIRHDVVHRNGKDKDGRSIEITSHFVATALSDIELFASSLNEQVFLPF